MKPTPRPTSEPLAPEPRLHPEQVERNFEELRPVLTEPEALLEAQRCFYCEYDAPCVRGCPTRIDIPTFIRQIAEGHPEEAGCTILRSNILGGVCARVCPVESLCEKNCICVTLHNKPIPIARLQRVATDRLMRFGELPFVRAAGTGRSVGIVGAGPAGLAAAFELARRGHDVVVYEKDAEPGGLDRYGIAEYKVRAPFVSEEMRWLLRIGGVRIQHVRSAVGATHLQSLRQQHDAMLLALGLGSTRRLGIAGEDLPNVVDALRFIRQIKMGPLHRVAVGSKVVVIGGGNTAIDAATQARRLGAEFVLVAFRKGRDAVSCTPHEYELSLSDGCHWRWMAQPVEIRGTDAGARSVVFQDTANGSVSEQDCDQVIKAIGQEPHGWLREVDGLALETNQTVRADPVTWMTTVPGLFAAGDCVLKAKEVVNAVYEGKCAALSIDGWLAFGGRAGSGT